MSENLKLRIGNTFDMVLALTRMGLLLGQGTNTTYIKLNNAIGISVCKDLHLKRSD